VFVGGQAMDEKKKVIKLAKVVKRCISCGERIRDNNWCCTCKEFVKERDVYPE
jgi:ribosomal protein L32|tara:strand:- start:24113 stop:24271 length:159 start_codon:yes stop_codon:yes gene_type:complete